MKFGFLGLIFCMLFLSGCTQPGELETITLYHWDFELDQNSPIYKIIQNKISVNLEALSAPWADWTGKLNVILASGNIPDIFITYGPGDADVYEKLVKDKLLLPLSPYLEQYPHIKKRLVGLERQKIDGEYYALPVQLTIDHTFFIRQDWLDECNLPLPQTIDDFYNIAVAFKAKYGIYPITSSPLHTSGFFWLNPLFFAFGGGWEIWIKEQSQYIPCWISSGNKSALEFINKLYREKLLDPEFFSNSDNDKVEKFINSRAGIMMHSSYPELVRELARVNPSARIAIFAPPRGPAGQAAMWSLDGFFTAVSINAKLKESKRKKVLELLDYLYSPEGLTLLRYGIKGTHWDLRDGQKVPILPRENEKYTVLERIDKTAGLKTFIELGGMWYPEWDEDSEILNQIRDTAHVSGIADIFSYTKTASAKEFESRLYDLTMQHYVKLVQSGNFERDWKIFKAEYLSSGGEKIILERNQ